MIGFIFLLCWTAVFIPSLFGNILSYSMISLSGFSLDLGNIFVSFIWLAFSPLLLLDSYEKTISFLNGDLIYTAAWAALSFWWLRVYG